MYFVHSVLFKRNELADKDALNALWSLKTNIHIWYFFKSQEPKGNWNFFINYYIIDSKQYRNNVITEIPFNKELSLRRVPQTSHHTSHQPPVHETVINQIKVAVRWEAKFQIASSFVVSQRCCEISKEK